MDTTERVQKSIANFKKLIPLFETFAEAVYGKKIHVRIPTKNQNLQMGHAAAYNDGTTIYIIPPLSLADEKAHDRQWCGVNSEKGIAYCPACGQFEDIFSSVCHELAHFTGGSSFNDRRDEELRKQAYSMSASWGQALLNVLEDIRIEELMFRAQVGTKIMRFGTLTSVVRSIEKPDFPLNSWAILALIAQATDYHFIDYPPVVRAFAEDPVVEGLIEKAKNAPDPFGIVTLLPALLIVGKKYGFFMEPEEREDEENNEGDSGNDGQESQDQEPNEDSEESDGSSEESEDSSGNGESENSDGSEDSDDGNGSSGENGSESSDDEAANDSDSRGTDGGTDSEEDTSGTDEEVRDGNDEESDGSSGDSGDSSDESGVSNDSSSSGDSERDGPVQDQTDSNTSNSSNGDGVSEAMGDSSESDRDSSNGADDEGNDSSGNDGNESDNPSSSTAGSNGVRTSDSESSDESDDLENSDASESEAGSLSETPGAGSDTDIPARPADAPALDSEPLSGQDEDDEPDDGSAIEPDPDTDCIDFKYGSEEEAIDLIRQIMGHKTAESDDEEDISGDRFRQIATAYEAFEEQSGKVTDLVEYKYSPGDGWRVWENGQLSNYNSRFKRDAQRSCDYYPASYREWWENSGILESSLSKMRVVFSENDKSKTQANRRSGKINTRALGKRAPVGDDRLFKKKTFPKKRDYAVLIMVDMSGSTAGERLTMEMNAVISQAELLSRMGIKFSVVAHSGTLSRDSVYDQYRPYNREYAFVKIVLKDWNEPWSSNQLEAAKNLFSYDCNLDGHALAYGRSEILKQRATDRLIMYYSDGQMPAENHDEELALLKKELKILSSQGVIVAGVGVNTDSPTKHGLPTVRLDSETDVPKVVDHLEKLMEARVTK